WRDGEASEFFRIDTLLVRRGHEEEVDAARGELGAEMHHGGERIARRRVATLRALREESDAWLVEEPAIATHERLFSGVAQREVLSGLHPRAERAYGDAGVLQRFVVSTQALRRRALGENLQRLRPFAASCFDDHLEEERRGEHREEDDEDEAAGS